MESSEVQDRLNATLQAPSIFRTDKLQNLVDIKSSINTSPDIITDEVMNVLWTTDSGITKFSLREQKKVFFIVHFTSLMILNR